jgi:tetratricopeptide (TPR) repeat protein
MRVDQVKCWSEKVTIPTYRIGEPDKNPMFLEKRVYQGSSGEVYPYPVIDRVFDEKEDQQYTAIFLENRYLKIMVLPEIGGRVQMALDKTNDYHFVYYNQVIKPALVGLTGPWISGGIEFNWPQHHRPTTFSPVDWRIETDSDRSKTIWCAEIEPKFRTKGMHGITLHPDCAYFEVNVQLYNRTSEPQTFLWWANPAVAVNDQYQSIFPPDVHAVMDHGKRDVSDFPIATGTYYKVDYAPGIDISRYKNIPVPTSYMVYHSDYDFVGCYDHDRQAGMMHVANHHVVPGKKQWTWGCGDFGQSWDRQLTDEDGPYIELMCGAYTDNQPDFTWLQPGEEKSFRQVFMPYKQIGGAKNASRDAVINLEIDGTEATIGVYLTRPRQVQIALFDKERLIYLKEGDLGPETALVDTVQLMPETIPQTLTLRVMAKEEELISFKPLPDGKPVIPDPAMPAKPPQDIASVEELLLNGLHLEQYRHATYAPEPYYEEALHRDPGDSRCNNAMGMLLYRRGKFADAEPYFRRAIERLTSRNPNPYDGEPFYNLGLSLKMQGRFEEAFDTFYKATWSGALQDAAFFELARLASRAGRLEEALELAERALAGNGRFHKSRHLKAVLLRHLGRHDAAVATVDESLSIDKMEYGALWEQSLLTDDLAFAQITHMKTDILIELALDYVHAGLFDDALALLESANDNQPMLKYTMGCIYEQNGKLEDAHDALQEAAELPADYCFPNRLEDVQSLTCAMHLNPGDPRAPYYLGNFWYAHRRYEDAIASWEVARGLDDQFATVHRNLALAY